MGLFDFLKKKKNVEAAPEGTIDLGAEELPGIDPPETRFTQEYKDFLEEQEKAEGRSPLPASPKDDRGADERSET